MPSLASPFHEIFMRPRAARLRPEPPSVSEGSSFWPMVVCTAIATAGLVGVMQPVRGVRVSAFATSVAGLLVAVGLFGVSLVRRRERRLVRAYDDALHRQLTRTTLLLSSARELTSESTETAVLLALPIHAHRLVPHDDCRIALFSRGEFVGHHGADGLLSAGATRPSPIELQVSATGAMSEGTSPEPGGVRYTLALPLHAGGELVAVVCVGRRSTSFASSEIDDAAVLCAHAGIALEKARALAQTVSIKREWEELFHSTAEGLGSIDADGRVRRANDALVALAGRPRSGVHHHVAWFAALPAARCPICETLRSGAPCSRTVHDAAGRTLELTTSPASGGGAVLVVRDVTHARAADESLRQARQRMFESEKLAAVGRLAAGVSHEVNNPLMGISGLATVLLDDDTLEGETREAVELIQREARRAAKITRDLLQFVHTGDAPQECVDTNALVHEVVRLRQLALQNGEIELELALADESPMALASAVPLMQVLINLMTNAEDAVSACERRAIRVATSGDAGSVRIVVEDSGPGVPASVRERLFEPFFTTKAPGKGTGLGLSLCYSIVERLGGTIRVEDAEAGRGARFVVELERYRRSAVELVA